MGNIIVTYITDDNYVIPTCVSIQSIKDSALAFHHRIKICTFGLSAENEKLLTNMSCEGFEVEICGVVKDKYCEMLERIQQKRHITRDALLKFELPNILEQENKVLYLDSDIIVKKDLSSLFQLDIDQYYVATVYQLSNIISKLAATGRLPIEAYGFNAGVMLLNLKALRENGIPAQLWKDKLSNMQSRSMDEDTLNRVLGEKNLHLPIIYNFDVRYLRGIDVEFVNRVYSTDYKTFDELIDDVVICHYMGGADKPWKYTTAYGISFWEEAAVHAGFHLEQFDRIKIDKGARYKIRVVTERIRTNGILDTIRYVMLRVSGRV